MLVTVDDGDDERGGDTAWIIGLPRAWHGEVSFGRLRSAMRHLVRTAHLAKPVTPRGHRQHRRAVRATCGTHRTWHQPGGLISRAMGWPRVTGTRQGVQTLARDQGSTIFVPFRQYFCTFMV